MKLHIVIPEAELQREFRWFYGLWQENAVKSYIVNHREIWDMMDKYLSLIGVGELYFSSNEAGKRRMLDMLFRRGRTYYAVEVKYRQKSLQFAWNQLDEVTAGFRGDMETSREPFDTIVPVLVSVSDSIAEPERHVID